MAIMAILEVTARPDSVDELRAMMQQLVPGTRAFDGCLGIALYAAEHDPAQIIFVEQWASRAAHERYVAWRTERGERDSFDRLCVTAPRVRYFNSIEADA